MIEVPHLEWHITHNCNLSCEACSHFTNHGHNWFADIETLVKGYSYWNGRISPRSMSILGGEPLLHKNVIDIIYLTREMWIQPKNPSYKMVKNSLVKVDPYFEIVTNGILLDKEKHKELPKALVDTSCTLALSLHSTKTISLEYDQKIRKTLNIIKEWKNEYGIQVKITDSLNHWDRSYNGFGINSQPFEDNDYKKSWDNCCSGQDCFQLYEGNIYKCDKTAYLNLQKNKYGPLLSEKWDKYLKYVPLTPDCSDEEIIEFFNKGAESVCGMCPNNPKLFIKNDPMIPVSYYEEHQEKTKNN